MSTTTDDHSRRNNRSSEDRTIVWLNHKGVNEAFNQTKFISGLEQAAQSVEVFENIDIFIDFITEVEKNGKIIAVISEEFCDILLPLFHDLEQVILVSIYSHDDLQKNNDYRKNFSKVCVVSNDADKIVDTLKREITIIEHNLEHISILDNSSKVDVNQLYPDFMYLQIFKELIVEIEYDADGKDELLEYCTEYCHNNSASLRVIDEFRRDYNKHSPIWWYSRDTFLYRLLNSSLRELKGIAIWKLRFFIKDLHEALVREQISCPVSVAKLYRGQIVSKVIFERIKRNIGGLISFDNFLSTTYSEHVARSFVQGIDENHISLVGMVFEIDVDTSIKTFVPYASIKSLSSMSSEDEILFSVPSIFRIGGMERSDDGIWNIQLKMTADDDQELRQLGNYVRHEFLENQAFSTIIEQARANSSEHSQLFASHENMLKFAQLMFHIHQFDDALRIIFERWVDLVDEDTINSRQTLSVFQNFANPVERLSKGSNTDQNVLERIENTLNHSPPTDANELANLYNSAASLTTDLDKELYYRMRHFELLEETGHLTATKFIEHHIKIGDIFSEQARLDDALTKYEIAWQKALESELTIESLLGDCYYKIGFTYQKLGDFEKAFHHHEKALDIYCRSLPSTHLSFHKVYFAYGICLVNFNRQDEAMEYFRKAIEVHRAYPGHEPIVEAEQQFAEIYCNPHMNAVDRKEMNDLMAKLDKLEE
ncbi:hypothetical protein I4U23_016382 [Adineta vaga]|nr:hypothetical protein I4U23_016382 [Adineta vaga]